jgi:hypothetical protein
MAANGQAQESLTAAVVSCRASGQSYGSVAAFVVDEEFGKLLFQRRDLGESQT